MSSFKKKYFFFFFKKEIKREMTVIKVENCDLSLWGKFFTINNTALLNQANVILPSLKNNQPPYYKQS